MTHLQQSRRAFLRTVGAVGGSALVLGSASAQDGTVDVRAVHASPDAPAVDVIVNDEPIAEGVEFPAVGGYFEGEAETFDIRVEPAGGGDPILRAKRQFDPGTAHSIAVVGSGDEVRIKPFLDRIEQPPAGEANWRFLNLIVGSPGFDVVVPNRQQFFRGTEFAEQSRYRSIRSGTYEVVLQRGSSDERLLSFADVPLEADTAYSAFGVGVFDGDPEPSLLLAEDRAFTR